MRGFLIAAVITLVAAQGVASDWSREATAKARDGSALVTCRSRLAGDFLLVELRPADGWHVYAMDNEQRAKEALAGRMSLGIEQNTEVLVEGDLQVVGDWYQSQPRDFSQPDLRWYSYGFEGTSLLAARVSRGASKSATVTVRAQACDSASCITVEAEMEVSLAGTSHGDFDPTGLVPVRGS